MKKLTQFDVIILRAWTIAKRIKIKPCNVITYGLRRYLPSKNLNTRGCFNMTRVGNKALKAFLQTGIRIAIERVVV